MPSVTSDFRTLERQKEALEPSKKGPHHPRLAALGAPHVESFNSIFDLKGGPGILERAVQDIGKVVVFDQWDPEDGSFGNKIECMLFWFLVYQVNDESLTLKKTVWLSGVNVGKPTLESATGRGALHANLMPSECRERGISYRSKIQAKLNWRVNGGPVMTEVRSFGQLPIMVKVINYTFLN
jgi:DNA-directed RNA polymerase I subunit RPA2